MLKTTATASAEEDCVTVRINAPVAWIVTVRTRAAVGVANTLPTYLLELVTVASLSFAF